MKINIDNLDTKKRNFFEIFKKKISSARNIDSKTINSVQRIINSVKKNGDTELLKLINKYDGYKVGSMKSICITKKEITDAKKRISKKDLISLKKSIKRILSFSKKQLTSSWSERKNNTSEKVLSKIFCNTCLKQEFLASGS